MEEHKGKSNTEFINNQKENEIKIIDKHMKYIMPRDIQNANTLFSSKINLNKLSWEVDGEKVEKTLNKIF
jgi:hypothetical protein